jgi:DNA topoisomerase I
LTGIEKLRRNGIRRTGSPAAGFRYGRADRCSLSRTDRDRIHGLRLPPAWREVRIAPSPVAKLQAVGKDSAGRWQYRYHEAWIARREKAKAARVKKFAEKLSPLRATVARDLRRLGLPRERVIAAIVRIVATRYLRPGSRAYARENDSYGVTTLRKKHVTFRNGSAELRFRGKSGKPRQVALEDRKAVAVLRGCARLRGRAFFQWRDEEGAIFPVSRRQLNAYIKDAMGDSFSAKDFRTWAGTLICANALARAGSPEHDSRKERRRKIVQAVAETAHRLGNTPAVCRASYISPAVFSSFERGVTLRVTVPSVEQMTQRTRLHPIERELVRLLEKEG